MEKVPLLALAALFSLLTIITQKQAPLTAIPPDIRVANALISYLIYLKKTVWPVHLAVFYPHPGYGVSWGLAVVAALALLGVSSLVWREAGRRPYLAVGWFWYLITLLPVIGLMQAGEQAMADRFTYVPLIGIFIILAWGALDLTAKRSHRNPALVLAAGLVLSACIILTWRQVGYWRDTKTLFEHANAVTENNHMAYLQLIYAYGEKGKIDENKSMFEKLIKLRPNEKEAYNNLGMAYSNHGNIEEAIAMLQKATEISPYFAASYNNLGIEYGTQGKIDEAILMFQKAIRTNPKFAEAYNNLGVAYTNQGKLDEAMAMFAKAIQVQPQFMKAYINLAISYVNQGQGQAAIDILKKAVRLNPDNQEARSMLEQLSW